MEWSTGSPLCVVLCRLREADWLNSMHGSRSKECATRREDGTRMRDDVSTVCNNFGVIAEGSESAETAVYGIAFVHARNNKPRRGTILFWFKATAALSTLGRLEANRR